MSKFLGLSKENCEVLIVEEPVFPLVCPDCIPDLSAPKIDWLSEDKPYFDPKTCEYIINYLAPKKVQGLKVTLNEYVKLVKPLGARILLKHFNKQSMEDMGNPTSDNYKKIKTSRRNVVVDRSNLIRIRISIDAIDFNKIPDRIKDPNEETPPDNTALNLPTDFIIDDTEGDFNINFITTLIGLRGYDFKYAVFKQTKGALIRKDSEDEFIIFKFDKFIKRFKSFKEKLDKFLEDNGFDFLSPLSFFSFRRKVQKLRIELDNSDEKNPLKINKLFIEAEGCPEVELLIGLDYFKEKAYMPDAIFLMANFSQMLSDITADPTMDWLGFADEYIYPPVLVDYGENPEDEKISDANPNCPAINIPFGDILENALKDLILTPADLIGLEFDKSSCSQDPKKSNPTVKQFLNPVKQREFEKAYRKRLRQLKKENESKIASYNEFLSKYPNETQEDYQKRQEEQAANLQSLLERIDRAAQESADKFITEDQRKNPDKYNPLYDQWNRALEAKFAEDNSIFEIWESIQESDDLIGEFTKFQTYIDLIGLCGLNEGLKKALSCLFKQVSFEDALQSAIKVAFETLPPDFFESVLLPGLTPLQQTEIRNKVANKLGTNLENVTWPWENKQSNKVIAQKKAREGAIRKQYVANLKGAVKRGVDEDAVKLYRDEQERQTRLFLKENPDRSAENLTPEEEEIIEESAYKVLENEQVNRQLSNTDSDISADLNELAGDIFEAYTEAFFEFFSIDDLLEKFNSLPIVNLLLNFAKSFEKCPTKVLQDLEQNEVKEFKLDICNPTAPVIDFKIPQLDFSTSPLKLIEKNISKIIRQTIIQVLSRLISTILKLIEDALCKLAELLGKAVLRPDQFFGDLPGTFREAFCPNASDEEAKAIGNGLLNKIGLKDDDISSAVDCLGGALAGSFTQQEFVSLLIDEKPSASLLDRVAASVKVGCPRFDSAFGDRDGAEIIFNNLRDLVPQSARNRLRGLTQIDDNLPLYDTICLTSEELELWDNIRRGNLESSGLSSEEAAEQIENYNGRARDALEDTMRDLLDSDLGPPGSSSGQGLTDALGDLFKPNEPRPPGCDLKDGESNYGSKAIKEPEEIVKVQDELSNRIMDIIGDYFDREFADSPSPFNPSLIHRIMRDTEGNPYGLHNFLSTFFLTRMDYHDSPGSEEKKESAPFWTKSFGVDDLPFQEDNGYFPETIGKELGTQATVLSEYKTQDPSGGSLLLLGAIPREYEVTFTAEYLQGDNNTYGAVGYVSDAVNPSAEENNLMNYYIYSDTDSQYSKLIEESVTIESDIQDRLNQFVLGDSKVKRSVFASIIQEKLNVLENPPTINYNALFDKTCEKIFNSTQKTIFDNSEGLIFGCEDEDLTEDQLKYVGPDGEDPYTNYFTEEDAVLGRAKEPTDRVFFLPPEQYGGSYQTPPVYIAPKRNKGWVKVASALAPEKSPCEPASESVIKFSQIKQHVNNVRNSMNHDSRLNSNVERCFVEKPFDKILSKNAAAAVDGISRMHVRMNISKYLTKIVPAIANVKFNDLNFDNSLYDVILSELYTDLSTVDPFWPANFKTHIYAMIVMEQLFQSFEREKILPLPSGSVGGKDVSSLSPRVQEAYQNIVQMREDYTYENIMVYPTAVKNLQSISKVEDPLNSEYFCVYALAYKKYGDAIFKEDFRFNWTGALIIPGYPPTPILPFVDYKLFSRALAIRLVLDDVKIIAKEVIKIEAQKMFDHFYETVEPKIQDITMFLLNSKDLFHNNNLENLGTTGYFKRIQMGSVPSIGDAEDCITTPTNESPWIDSPQDEVIFKLEKFVRFYRKQETTELLETVRDRFGTTLAGYLDRGVMNLESAQEFIDVIKEDYGDYYITQLFGDAVLSDDANSYTGQIGISYGLRMVMKVPESLFSNEDLEELGANDSNLSKKQKAFYSNIRSKDFGNANNFSIPFVSREIELTDVQIKDIDFSNGDDKYDLVCLLNKIRESEDYRLLFKYLCPVKAASSMMAIYSNNFFIESIGMDDGWTEDKIKAKKDFLGNWDHKVGADFEDTNKICRKYFASFYDSSKFLHSENFRLPKLEFPDFLKMLFGSFDLPSLNLSIQLPEINFGHKIITKNPLNKNNEVCEEPVDKFIK